MGPIILHTCPHLSLLKQSAHLQILDRRLLARLCVMHLDLERASGPQESAPGFGAVPSPFFFHQASVLTKLEGLPPATMAFLKEILKQSSRATRLVGLGVSRGMMEVFFSETTSKFTFMHCVPSLLARQGGLFDPGV